MKWLAFTLLWAVIAGVLVGGAVVGWRLSGLPYLDTPDKVFYDLRSAAFAKLEPAARPEFAIVSISDRTLNGYPAVKPVDRGLVARLINELRESDVRAIGLTFQIDRPTETEKDDALLAAIRAMDDRIAVGVIDSRSREDAVNLKYQETFVAGAPRARKGHLYFDVQKSGIGQQPDLAVRFLARRSGKPDEVAESFAEGLLAAAGIRPLDIGQTRIVAEGEPGPHIAWTKTAAANSADAFTRIDLMEHGGPDATERLLPPWAQDILRGRIVIIGADLERNDRHLTPFTVLGGARMTNAEIHAQVAAQLKDGRRVATLALPWELGLAFGIGALAFLVGYVRGFRGHKPSAVWGNADYFLVGVPLAIIAAGAFAVETLILPTDTMLYAALGGVFGGHFWFNFQLPALANVMMVRQDREVSETAGALQ